MPPRNIALPPNPARVPRFIEATAGTLVTQAINAVTGALFAVILARGLGPESRGSYAVIVLVTSLLSQLASLGIPNATVYLIGQGQIPLATIAASGLAQATFAGVLTAPVAVLVLGLLPDRLLTPLPAATVWVAAATIALQMITVQVRHTHAGSRAIHLYNALLLAESILLCVCLSVTALGTLRITSAIMSYALALATSTVLHFASLRYLQVPLKGRAQLQTVRQAARFGWKLWIAGFGGFLADRSVVLILGLFKGPAVTGIYAVALNLPTLLANLPNAVAAMTYPWIAHTRDKAASTHMASRILPTTVILTSVAALPLILFAGPLLVFFYGAEYRAAAGAMQLVTIATVISGLTSVIYSHLAGVGAPGYGAILSGIQLIVIATAAATIIPWLGITGAATARLIAAAVGAAYLIWALRRISDGQQLFRLKDVQADWRTLIRSVAESRSS